jgi:hypothetical protein
MRRIVTGLIIVGWLAGCASSASDTWAKPGATEQQIGRDTTECLLQAQMIESGPRGPRTVIQQDRYRGCMVGRGYAAGPAK